MHGTHQNESRVLCLIFWTWSIILVSSWHGVSESDFAFSSCGRSCSVEPVGRASLKICLEIRRWSVHCFIHWPSRVGLRFEAMFVNYIVYNSSCNVLAHGEAREGKWRGNWRMEWVASTLHTTLEHGVSSVTIADAHTSAAMSRLNWFPRWFKWTRPLPRKMKSGFCACAITFQLASTTPLIRIKKDGEPSGYSENTDNGIFLWK